MIRIVDRYLARETALATAAVTGVLMLILLSNKFASLLGDAAAGRLPRETVFTLLALASIKFFIVVVPVATFLAIMLALGRLYRDSEMTTLMACGVGPLQIYRPLMIIAALLAAGLAVLSLQVSPWAERMTRIVNSAGMHDALISSFESGRFKVNDDGRGALYAEHVSQDGRDLQKVFMQGPSGDLMAVVIADRGHRVDDPKVPGGGMLVLNDGWRYEGLPGKPDYRIVKFVEHGIVISPPRPDSGLGSYDAYPTSQLLALHDLEAASTVQWRLSVPISVLLLTLLAVPLAKTSPRQGRYGRLLIAILVYLIFYNVGILARVWEQKGVSPVALGMWWVDVLALIGVAALLIQQYGLRGLFAASWSPRS
ncbi:MAG TPA: LPS export ABC transporter permease LptF [Gammaproteobacteria bacterium]|nr:LPS export ABC transporter permease LptF [Gammaproteobacteria bacterium]